MAENSAPKQILSVLLAFCLLFATPILAFADESSSEEETLFSTLTSSNEDMEEEAEESTASASKPQKQPRGDFRVDLLNGADLDPSDPRSQALSDYLDELLEELIDDDMDTYDQVKVCYDYLVDNLRYGSHTANLGTPIQDGVTCRQVYNAYGEVEGFGSVALTAKTGMCNAYASAFILMTQKIGLDSYLVKGSTRSRGGGYAYHEWAEVRIGEQVYLFDPQLEQDLRKAGLAPYTVFCSTYDQVPGRYAKY